MIVINKHLAKEALANAVNSGRVTPKSGLQAYLLQTLVSLNYVFRVKQDPMAFVPKDFSLDAWSTLEIATADTVTWLIALLQRAGCHDIEQLLRDVVSYRSRHPDYPTGPWPHSKTPR